jgi:hypothetical protein
MFLLGTERTKPSEHYRKDRTMGQKRWEQRVLGQIGQHKVVKRGQLKRTDGIVKPGQEIKDTMART